MEDDDEFGDLYTDVLSAFPSSVSQPPPSTAPQPIDLNLQSDDVDLPEFTSSENDNNPSSVVANDLSLLPNSKPEEEPDSGVASKIQGVYSPPAEASGTRVSQAADLNLTVDQAEDRDKKDGNELDVVGASKDGDSHSKGHNFGIEDELNGGMEDLGSEPIIPGLDTGPSVNPGIAPNFGSRRDEDAIVEGDDWDSDSEDDLQIVLNDNNHGPMSMDANGMMVGSDDEDEDGEPLIIVADDDATHQSAEEQDWGEDATQASDGKELTDAAKPNGGVATAPKIGYGNYGYHPFHSQFKYVRPGAAPLPGGPLAGSGGALGQVRPPVHIGAMSGRGRSDWRPPGMKGPSMQKGFHPGFWGSNVPGRGLEFTLPSHKTIFDVEIDSFEEKPWKYSGVDISDFFNFGLNEDSWKEYCKQLEQLRLESTMQSKIRVYESGRAEQEYDPDLPPELAAAAGIHDSSAEIADVARLDAGLGDLAKGSARVRPPLPIGRAIQVETGYAERLPSVDTRPSRLRDSDAVIEIVLQGSMDDESIDKADTEHPENDTAREDDKVDVVGVDGPEDGDKCLDGYSQGFGGVKEDFTGRRSPVISSSHNDSQDEERDISSPQRSSSEYCSGSRGHAPTKNVGSPYEERWTKGKTHERSPRMSSGESALNRRSLDYQQEDSAESMEDKCSPALPSPNPTEDPREPSLERKDAPENDIPAVKKPEKVKDNDLGVSANTSMDKNRLHFTEHKKLSSHVEPPPTNEVKDGGDFKASRSSENSKGTGSSRDHQKWHEGVDEEVVQNGRSTYAGNLKRHHDEGGHDSRRKNRDERMELERNYVLSKGKEGYYSHGDRDPYAANRVHLKPEGIDRKKERDYSESSCQRRDEDVHGWRVRAEDARKQDRVDEMVSRHRGKGLRETDRRDKDEHLHSRKLLDNGCRGGYHDKDVGLRYWEKDDSLKSRLEVTDDHHSKRRKDERLRRDHVEKEGILLTHRESSTARRKRERDGVSIERKRDEQPRLRDNIDDHHSVRPKDEVWVQRERAEQQRERDEWYRSKLSYEENLSRREKEDGRPPIRSNWSVEEKTRVGLSRGKEYKGHDKDTGRHSEHLNRMDWVEDETSLQHRGNDDAYGREGQFSNEGKRSRSSARNDHPARASDNQRVHEKKHKDNMRKTRQSEGTPGPSKRHQGEKGLANEMADLKIMNECAGAKHDIPRHTLTGESRDYASSDDEQHGSKKGRSKLERWTSHKERDYAINSKLSSSLKIKEISKDKSGGCESSSGVQGGSVEKVEDMDKNRSLARTKEGGGSEGMDAAANATVDGHLETVEKLKRRSERFKLPLTSEKDGTAIKKMESEVLPPSQSEIAANSQVKQERPARKRRWISS